ncbi:unnamed protein product [Rhodiola kirilowii]
MQSSKGQAWFCTTGLPSDIVVDVADMTFHLHKFPLMSRSRKLHEMITENESAARYRDPQSSSTAVNEEEDDEDADAISEVQCQISFQEFPGGSETFEAVAKFCYGVKIELSASNVAPLRCAAEFLEMTDEYSEGNLISKTEMFLSHSTLKSGKECVKALKSCEKLMPLAEELSIIERCVDAFVSRVGSEDTRMFGWPVVDEVGGDSRVSNQDRQKSVGRNESWLQDVARLGLPLFKRLILEMRGKEVFSEVIENCLIFYAIKCIPGISRSSRVSASSPAHSPSQREQRELLETIVTNLPLKRSSRSSPVTRYLFGLLRTANILNATESCRSVLEKKIGFLLDQATLDDLLIPSFSYLNETLYDIDCVERILRYFLDGVERRSSHPIEENEEEVDDLLPALTAVGKLIDGYLSEIASDANLKPDKFIGLAVSLPEQSRVFDDGLYRAVDVYLKAHPWLSETEREKICGIMDCQKLTLDACTHAAQNERLPLRAVVQVLFFEQLQLRQAIAGSLIAAEGMPSGHLQPTALDGYEQDENEVDLGGVIAAQAPAAGRSTWKAAVRENQVLLLDMDSMRTRVHQLEHECSTMKKVIENIDKTDSSQRKGWKGSLSKKVGCKFKTQVCDSHESNVVNTRGRRQNRP